MTWASDSDTPPMYLVANEICKAVQDGAQARLLFWIRWLLEEDNRIRKETKGHGVTSKERGPAFVSPKARTEVGYFIAELLFNIYKELAEKGIRMHEEFREIYNLYRCSEKRMAASLRKDCLGLMALICCEVPRWKVQASQTLVADPMRLSRAVAQSPSFFNEVLSNPMRTNITANMTKAKKEKKILSEKDKKELTTEDHFSEYDKAMESYLNRWA
jgi:hypothetical protein